METRLDLNNELNKLGGKLKQSANNYCYSDFFNTLFDVHETLHLNKKYDAWHSSVKNELGKVFVNWTTGFLHDSDNNTEKKSGKVWALQAYHLLSNKKLTRKINLFLEESLDDINIGDIILDEIESALLTLIKDNNKYTTQIQEELSNALITLTLARMEKQDVARNLTDKINLSHSILAGLSEQKKEEKHKNNDTSTPLTLYTDEGMSNEEQIMLARALSLSEEKIQTLSWTPEEKNTISFTLVNIPADGECAITSMGIGSRAEAVKRLLEVKKDQFKRTTSLIAPEIKAALLSNQLTNILMPDAHLLIVYETLTHKINTTLQQKSNLLTNGKKWLNKDDVTDIHDDLAKLLHALQRIQVSEPNYSELNTLITKLNKQIIKQEKLNSSIHNFCNNLLIQNLFIKEYVAKNGTWLAYDPNSTTSMDAIAETHNLCLLIYMKDNNNQLKLMHRYTSESTTSPKIVALLHTYDVKNSHYHFDRLDVESSSEKSLYTYLNVKMPLQTSVSQSGLFSNKESKHETDTSDALTLCMTTYNDFELNIIEKISFINNVAAQFPALKKNETFNLIQKELDGELYRNDTRTRYG